MIFYKLWFFLHCEDPLRGINTCVEPDLAPRTDQNLQLAVSHWHLVLCLSCFRSSDSLKNSYRISMPGIAVIARHRRHRRHRVIGKAKA